MRIPNGSLIRISLALWCFVVVIAAANAQESKPAPSSTENLIYSLKGPDLFRAYCAACHGLSGKGNGPAAQALKAKVPDLTLLSRNKGGQFPSALVRELVAGDDALASHGSREMPIWGPIFHRVEEDRDFGNVRLENLVKYLESIQSDATLHPVSGAELYKENCAVCHGEDLKGGGPVPYPYRVPPDLTKLARAHGGKFPEGYVSDVLQLGVILPAHGPAEMPVWGSAFRLGARLDDAQIAKNISELTNYIKSCQAK